MRANVRDRIAICILEYYYLSDRDFNAFTTLFSDRNFNAYDSDFIANRLNTVTSFHQKRKLAICTISLWKLYLHILSFDVRQKKLQLRQFVNTSSVFNKVKFLSLAVLSWHTRVHFSYKQSDSLN